ncbi:MAG: 2-hydroxyacid dehydrogenase [Candidatus Binatia bacterium]
MSAYNAAMHSEPNLLRTAVFSTKSYDRQFLGAEGATWPLTFFEPRLTRETALLAKGYDAICAFVNDQLDKPVLEILAAGGTRFIALRSAGFNHVDLVAAAALGFRVARVPAYSPYAVAEHTVGLMLALNRRIPRAANRVRDGNFSLENLLGFDMHGKTVGIVGTGKIGAITARILAGFGCHLLFHDVHESDTCRTLGKYVPLAELLTQSDIISLHCPLTPETFHLINPQTLAQTKRGVMLINTSRGALVTTQAIIDGLKSGHIGYVGLDVYEEETDLFFQDLSGMVLQDDVFARLLTFPNVLVTAHQAFFTQNALEEIARVTFANLRGFAAGQPLVTEVKAT